MESKRKVKVPGRFVHDERKYYLYVSVFVSKRLSLKIALAVCSI